MKIAREAHDVNSLDCPCGPTFHRLCAECNGSPAGCWNCQRGLVEITRSEAEWEPDPIVIVHADDEDS